ncbi:MAG: DUF1080 domain-containing protein [Verrucomicrobiales bacterium]|nr:DUF1080 domain-containing protein [Verrucomicrobiales bacterium]
MISRRRFLRGGTLFVGGLATAHGLRRIEAAEERKYRVAAVTTEYRGWSHADVILGRFIQGHKLDLTPHWPEMPIRALYVDQFPPTDLSRGLCRQYGVPIVPSIAETILDADGKLAVDGVVLVGEHGDYPTNERGQQLYPRRRFFEETVAAFRKAGRVVPVFNDKHLAARWEDAKWMYDTAKAMGIPFMAGSSLPLTWRRPWLEIPIGTPFDEALSVGYGGLESYGFHALETLQCMVERRRGGEAGVVAVQCLENEAVWDAMRAGRFSRDLVAAALARNSPPVDGDFETRCPNPAAFLIEYADGFRATTLMLNGVARNFLFAAKLTGDAGPVATQFWLQEPTFGHFDYLANAIKTFVRTGTAPYPVERTVLTTGILAAAMDSKFENHRRVETPDLRIPYAAVDHDLGAYRNPESVNARHGGWIELFNGTNLDGWRENRFAHEPRWEVVDGVLTARGGQGYLATLEEFADLELFAEVRITDSGGGRGNSGIYIRCQPHANRKEEFPPGYEVQCDHGDGNNPTGSIYNLGAPGAAAPKSSVRDGEWFTLRIRARGNHLQSWVNGTAAADCRDPRDRFRKGAILLQQHHKTGIVEFRQVRIRRL